MYVNDRWMCTRLISRQILSRNLYTSTCACYCASVPSSIILPVIKWVGSWYMIRPFLFENHQFSASAVELEFLHSERRLRFGRHFALSAVYSHFRHSFYALLLLGLFFPPPPLSLCFDLWAFPSELAWIWLMDLPLASLRSFAFMRACSPFLVPACLWFWFPSTAAWCIDKAYSEL